MPEKRLQRMREAYERCAPAEDGTRMKPGDGLSIVVQRDWSTAAYRITQAQLAKDAESK